jgi:galactose mutarotase-like enzyme
MTLQAKTRKQYHEYIGDYSQLLGIKDYVFASGRARGVKAYDVKNGSGLELTILADRCLDIPYLTYKGINLGFVSKVGIAGPEYYVEDEFRGFLKNFNAGFLTTCGLTYMGKACVDEGRKLGLHGPIANIPAELPSATMTWQDDTAVFAITGSMREACFFDEYLVLNRTITLTSDSNRILIEDEVENRGHNPEPLMLLYHFNFGYPFLQGDCRLHTNLNRTVPRDSQAAAGIDNWQSFDAPQVNYNEQVFFHTTTDSDLANGIATVTSPSTGLEVAIRFDPKQLPWLNHWKCPRAGEYALGIEPGTCHVAGRSKARADGDLLFIQPGEMRHFQVAVDIREL